MNKLFHELKHHFVLNTKSLTYILGGGKIPLITNVLHHFRRISLFLAARYAFFVTRTQVAHLRRAKNCEQYFFYRYYTSNELVVNLPP